MRLAFIADDVDLSWQRGPGLNASDEITYPDDVEDRDGVSFLFCDHPLTPLGESLMAPFREGDVRASRALSSQLRQRQDVSRQKGSESADNPQ